MKTAVHASSIFSGALAVFLLLCSTAQLSMARATKGQPAPPHLYDEYPIRRVSVKKALDATDAALFFLGQARNEQGYLLPRHSSTFGEIPFRTAVGAALKAYEAMASYGTLLSTNTGAVEIQRGLKSDICTWISSALQPETNFTCTDSNILHFSQVMKVHETLLDFKTKVAIIAPTTDEWQGLATSHYQCAWVNSRALKNCSTPPRKSLLTTLNRIYQCSILNGNYDLCSNA